jgi:hypothetical protein
MKSVFTILSIVIFTQAYAQKMGMYVAIYKAQGEFNRNIDRNPVGMALNYLHPISNRLDLCVELGIAMYSNKTYYLPYQGKEIEIYEEDCFWTFHFLGQYKIIEAEHINLYLEGRFGWTTFFSSKNAVDTDEAEEYEMSYKSHGKAFNSGLALGINYNIFGNDKIFFDFSMGINSGSKSRYRNANENTTNFEDGDFYSLTHYTNYRIGLQYKL